jgi:dolichyl-phosphate-mannose--protein O-mannosyl transferase
MSTSKADLRARASNVPAATTQLRAAASAWLWLLLGAGFVIRLLFMGNEGFKNDVSSFEAWSATLLGHPFSQFYAATSFADYPPGYFYVLWLVGHVWGVISPHGNYDVLKYLVKLPAVVMDLIDGALVYAIARRFATERIALVAAALFVLNPATIFISAAWGQVDSISSGFALAGIYFLIRSQDGNRTSNVVAAWSLLAYSLLIKPQAAVLIPLFIAFAFVDRSRLRERLTATGAGIVAALAVALVLTLPFHPTANPIDAFSWLLSKYTFGKNVYAYNSVNAFNLWSAWHPFWQGDSTPLFGLPQYAWGMALVLAATALVVVRYVQARTGAAFLEAAALLTLAFFMLATRMHERYIYDGLLLSIVCVPFAKRYLWASVIFSFTLLVNLFYSYAYLQVVTQGTPGVNPADMWPWVTHPLSILNIATFFYLGYVFLGSPEEAAVRSGAASPSTSSGSFESASASLGVVRYLTTTQKARAWFDPREGLAKLVWPLDYVLASLFGGIAFVLSYVNYRLPGEKIFDEIYFARAAEEYLGGRYIYENTHPPLTKLIITLSTMMFGGLAHGDNAAGWRFLDVVFGAVAIVLVYVFAKRLTRSTLFASVAAIMFTADGMHFVQSRIATPEGIVVVFSVGALYAFYRFWIASQCTLRRYEPNATVRVASSAGVALLLGMLCGWIVNHFGNPPGTATIAGFVVGTLYFTFGWYLLFRLVVAPRFFGTAGEFVTYADGTQLIRQGPDDAKAVFEPAYDRQVKNKDVTVQNGEAAFVYRKDGTVAYQTPVGSAVYSPGLITDDEGESQQGGHATLWLVVFTLLLGALVASKWYGVMAYGVSFIVVAFVWAQRFWAQGRAKRWGNPFGFRLDVAVAAIVFISMSVYICAWIPDLVRHVAPPGDTGVANVRELVYRQYSMFEYHDTLKATHPYASKFWSWPLDLRPISYYWKDTRANPSDSNGCCVAEILSLPNPLIMWFGLLCVPLVGVLAWYEKNKGYALLVLAYLLQWLPWALSPRLAWIYHFYVDVPLVVLCNVIVLQRIWNAGAGNPEVRTWTRAAVGAYVAAVVLAFAWFYPILAGVPLHWNDWWARMWLGSRWV